MIANFAVAAFLFPVTGRLRVLEHDWLERP